MNPRGRFQWHQGPFVFVFYGRGGGALRAYDFVIVDECVWQMFARGCQLLQLYAFFSSWPAYCNFLLRLSSLLEVLSDINCAASFLDNCRQVSMADRSAWRQKVLDKERVGRDRKWNAEVTEPNAEARFIGVKQARLVGLERRGRHDSRVMRPTLFSRIIHLLLNVFP